MTLDDLTWSQGCCGEASRYAEAELPNGHWLQVWQHTDGHFSVWEYDNGKRAIDSSRRTVSRAEVESMLS
jgi:hypothetical protein